MPKIELTSEVDHYEIHAVIKTKIGESTDYTKHFVGTLTGMEIENLFVQKVDKIRFSDLKESIEKTKKIREEQMEKLFESTK